MGNNDLGRVGEVVACQYLRKKGYRIVEQNFRCKLGEVDIIAKDGDVYVFTEVKTRRNKKYGRPIEAINAYKLRNIIQTVQVYVKKKHLYSYDLRIDVIEVFVDTEGVPECIHTMNISY